MKGEINMRISSTKQTPELVIGALKQASEKLPEKYSKKLIDINLEKQKIEARIAQREEELIRLRTINQFMIKFSNEGLSDEERRIYELKEQNRLDNAALIRLSIQKSIDITA